MSTTTSLIALVILLLAWMWAKRAQDNNQQKKGRGKRPKGQVRTGVRKPVPSSTFHAVSIKFGSDACNAAKDLRGKRFLSNAAPRLPLPECSLLQCKCRFMHYKDRRTDADRRNPLRGSLGVGSGEYEEEKRDAKDRRAEPPDEF